MNCQRKFYPDILTDETIRCIRDEIIYYQRPLKSCKYLVSRCEFEKRFYLNAAGKKTEAGPKVSPRTSPLFQVCRLWESINNIVVHKVKNLLFPGRSLTIPMHIRTCLVNKKPVIRSPDVIVKFAYKFVMPGVAYMRYAQSNYLIILVHILAFLLMHIILIYIISH